MTAVSSNRRPYFRLYRDIFDCIAQIPDFAGDPFLMMAICVRESMGVPWFCRCDSLYKTRLDAIKRRFGMATSNNFAQYIAVNFGVYKGQIPKFQFVDSDYERLSEEACASNVREVERIALSCRFGMAQKRAATIFASEPIEERISAVRRFAGDPEFQLSLLAHDLSLLDAFRANVAPAVVGCMRDTSPASHAYQYGVQMLASAEEFRRMYGLSAGDLPGRSE